ncbi:binding-protein-dependent transport systems inner membrane component [Candidatus Vecturithrix granuli]|uniref:Binding-protein-dependent transport systems inner membrane component n=1 Tax=Vecturithrix granuli TaxID=1499967 RepID=A0A081C3L0_VECG1|nr:binding-protein-dependent transport systems inner membrane component [Candidatus Vecturithrix granuli]
MNNANTSAIRPQSSSRFWTIERRKWMFCYTGLLPVLGLFMLLRIIPIVRTFILSFYDSDLINPQSRFIGVENYLSLFSDYLFRTALLNTTLFAVGTVTLSVGFGLFLALLMNQKIRLSAFYETVYFLPVITPMVPVSIIWKWIYDPSFGLLNYILSWFGIDPVGWLVYPKIGLWAIVVMSAWKLVGYNMVLFLVGLRSIPDEYVEAAALDGAGRFGLFRYITLPLLKPIILLVVVINTISSYNVFTQVYVMTAGSQGTAANPVRVLVYDIWENAFRYFRMGYASAEAVILFLIVLLLTLVQFRAMRSEEV